MFQALITPLLLLQIALVVGLHFISRVFVSSGAPLGFFVNNTILALLTECGMPAAGLKFNLLWIGVGRWCYLMTDALLFGASMFRRIWRSCFNYAHSMVLLRNWDTSHVSTEFCLAVTWVGLLVGNVWTFSGCSPADADCRSFCCSSLVRFRWSRTTSTTPFVCVELSERSKTKFLLQPGHGKMFNQQRKELFLLEQFEIKSWGLLRCMFSTFTAHGRLENALCVHLGCHDGMVYHHDVFA